MISAVAEMYGIHPQTLRFYEREGLLKPSRTEGDTCVSTPTKTCCGFEYSEPCAGPLGVDVSGIHHLANARAHGRDARQIQDFVKYFSRKKCSRAPTPLLIPRAAPSCLFVGHSRRRLYANYVHLVIINQACSRQAHLQ